MARIKTTSLRISRQINAGMRDYAIYTLTSRGIPNFYDALTNVQRLILQNAPAKPDGTLALVGQCIAGGYHHGDSSLQGAIAKMARPFGCAEPMLEGVGFFGSIVQPAAAAARYTKVKQNPSVRKLIDEHGFLNTRNDEDGAWDPLWVEVPVGLLGNIVGIATAYRAMVLPRKLEDIRAYLAGKKKGPLIPHFRGFKGKVRPWPGIAKTWVLEGAVEADEARRTVRVTDIPPLMRYGKFIQKVDAILDVTDASVANNSTDEIDITFSLPPGCEAERWELLKDRVLKATKMLATESLVFIKDGSVAEYDRVEEYLDEFRPRAEEVRLRGMQHHLGRTTKELEFLRAKVAFLEFMLERRRSNDDIAGFLRGHPRDIADRLDTIKLTSLSVETLERTRGEVAAAEARIEEMARGVAEQEARWEAAVAAAPHREERRALRRSQLLDPDDEVDGIEVFRGEDGDDEEGGDGPAGDEAGDI